MHANYDDMKFTKLAVDGQPPTTLTLPKGVFPEETKSGDEFVIVSHVKVSETSGDAVSVEVSDVSANMEKEKMPEKEKPTSQEDEEEEEEPVEENRGRRGKFTIAVMGGR